MASIQGPKVMLIDETAGSGGDLHPQVRADVDVQRVPAELAAAALQAALDEVVDLGDAVGERVSPQTVYTG